MTTLMRDKVIKYKVHTFRLSEKVYRRLCELKDEGSWNLYFQKLINLIDGEEDKYEEKD